MTDPLKSFTALANAKHKAVVADAAAKAMAEHCDERIAAANATIKALVEALKASRDYIDERTIPRTEREALFTQIDAALKLAGEK